MNSSRRPRALSGIRPTGVGKHLGNYLGAVRQWVALQEDHECFFFVADLHALTTTEGGEQLSVNTRNTAAELLAMGINPDRSAVFVQSHLSEHTELGWVLQCLTGFGEASRMTQFKDKGGSSSNVGLFTYPVLQAADILLYQPSVVPIGEDQRQHLELTRDLAQRFNKRFGDVLAVPEPYVGRAAQRIKDLQEPEVKMSTSRGGQGTLWIMDDPSVLVRKIKAAVTDAGRDVRAGNDKPGVTNLLTILSVAANRSVSELELEQEGKGYGEFKSEVAEAVVELFAPMRRHYEEYLRNPDFLDEVLHRGAEQAQEVAAITMHSVRERLGLLPRRL